MKKSGLGDRARPLVTADKYLKGVLGQAAGEPELQPEGVQLEQRTTFPTTLVPSSAGKPEKKKSVPWEEGKPDSGRMVPKTWHLPEDLARRFDNFLVQKCRPGTRGVKVVRQILDDFLKKQGF